MSVQFVSPISSFDRRLLITKRAKYITSTPEAPNYSSNGNVPPPVIFSVVGSSDERLNAPDDEPQYTSAVLPVY